MSVFLSTICLLFVMEVLNTFHSVKIIDNLVSGLIDGLIVMKET